MRNRMQRIHYELETFHSAAKLIDALEYLESRSGAYGEDKLFVVPTYCGLIEVEASYPFDAEVIKQVNDLKKIKDNPIAVMLVEKLLESLYRARSINLDSIVNWKPTFVLP